MREKNMGIFYLGACEVAWSLQARLAGSHGFYNRVCKAELRPPEVDPYFERKKITLGGVTKNY